MKTKPDLVLIPREASMPMLIAALREFDTRRPPAESLLAALNAAIAAGTLSPGIKQDSLFDVDKVISRLTEFEASEASYNIERVLLSRGSYQNWARSNLHWIADAPPTIMGVPVVIDSPDAPDRRRSYVEIRSANGSIHRIELF